MRFTAPTSPAFAAQSLDVAAIVYTSGTTSRPKGVVFRHAAHTESSRSFPGWIGKEMIRRRGENELKTWAAMRLAPYKVPSRIPFPFRDPCR